MKLHRTMTRLGVLLACGALAAGCGSDEEAAQRTAEDAAAAAQTQADAARQAAEDAATAVGTAPGAATTPEATSTPSAGAGGAQVEAAVKQCEAQIDAAPQLSDAAKDKLRKSCQAAADGDVDAVRRATREVCETTVEETVPAGPAREQALSTCKAVGG